MAIALLQKDFLKTSNQFSNLDEKVFGRKIGLFTSIFGCSHEEITRPFTEGKSAYRACLNCGARKPFNPETMETDKKFYYPPIVKILTLE